MADNQALYNNGYVAEQQRIRNQIAQRKAEITAYKEKIERLKNAKKAVKRLKDQANDIKSSASKKNVADKFGLTWKGNNYDIYVELVKGTVKTRFTDYVNRIDDCLDDIVDRITYYENKIIERQTIISGLWIQFNNIGAAIEKLFN